MQLIMQNISFNTDWGHLSFWGDRFHVGHGFYIDTNCKLDTVKYLLFFDSRGISAQWETSLLKKLLDYLSSTAYLVVARPLELTTWATLFNFMKLNNIQHRLCDNECWNC
jgi:hypothetical protein